MRIAELVDSLEFGGTERMVADLSRSLEHRGHSLLVICLRQAGTLADSVSKNGIEVIAMDKQDGFSLHTMRRIAAVLKERHTEVLHTHNPLVHHYGILAGRMAGVRTIVNTIHGPDNLSRYPGSRELIYGFSCRCWTDRVVAVRQTAREIFARNVVVPEKKLETINNGIPLETFLKVEPRQTREPFRFGAVGRLAPVKDHATLIAAFAEASPKMNGATLEILGDGPLRRELEREIAALGMEGRVTLRGYSADVAGFLARLNVFVMSSQSEGLPLTMLESMAAALPQIGTDVGGIPKLIEEANCGWLTPASNRERMAETMLEAYRANDLAERGARARRLARESYSLEQMTERYEQLFEQLMKSNN